ncbi:MULTISPECIES: DUF6712 family protein [Olivibacter]|uniref:DUF6712 family protein n=1 Tax=Olivibacter jilunii TaxID=985016 RepID=A0ABW6B2I4_9SPHI
MAENTTIITTTSELKQLTGSFYANNDFTKIRTDIELESEKLKDLIGDAVFERALTEYDPPTPSEDDDLGEPKEQTPLVNHVQLPIALMSAYRFYQSNIVSHEDGGRKVKIDSDNEKMAWQWMLDRDDEAQLKKAQRAIDRLIAYLDNSDITEWLTGDKKLAAKDLFLPNPATFQQVFPIDNSPRFYYMALPFIKSEQNKTLRPAMGEDYSALLTAFRTNTLTNDQYTLLALVQEALALRTISVCVRRLSLQVLPEGIVQGYRTYLDSMKGSKSPDLGTLKLYTRFIDDEADEAMGELRKWRNRNTPGANDPVLLPNNDPCNKYFRT